MSEGAILISAMVGLFLGPTLLWVLGRRSWWLEFVDGYILFSVGGIALCYLLPKSLVNGGVWAGAAACLGAGLPHVLQKRFLKAQGAVLFLFLLGLLLHSAFDGAALALPSEDHQDHLQISVLLQHFPIGLVVFWAFSQRLQVWKAFGLVGLLALVTLVGYASAGTLDGFSSSRALILFEAFIVGVLLHVLVHARTWVYGQSYGVDKDGSREALFPRTMAFLGALLGVMTFLELGHGAELLPSSEGSLEFWPTALALIRVSAPTFLLAYVLVSIFSILFAPWASRRLQGGTHLSHGFKGVWYGFFTPLSPRDVLSRYSALIRSGAPVTIALAFLLATSGLALEALLISVPLLGNFLTGARFFAAIIVALVVAWTVGQSLAARSQEFSLDKESTVGWGDRVLRGFRFGFGELVDHTLPWALLGLGVAALMEPLLEPTTSPTPDAWGLIRSIPNALHVPLAATLGFPFYICGAGATLVGAIVLHKGLSAGPVLAFLLLAPVLNTTTMSAISGYHGRGTAIRVGAIAFVVAVWVGWFVDLIFGGGGLDLRASVDGASSSLEDFSLIVLAGLCTLSLFRQGLRGFLGRVFRARHGHEERDVHAH